MSEANETNDKLAEIKEQIMIATHETGEMPKIMRSKKKADSNRGYFYDAQDNVLYLRDEQTWNAIKDNLSADLSSDDMGINVSIQPLQGIDGAQGEIEEDLQDKIDKINQDSQYEYYRLIKRHGSDYLLCYSFNNIEDRDRFAAEMDDALGVGNGDVGDGAKYDYDDEEIDENFSDNEVLDKSPYSGRNSKITTRKKKEKYDDNVSDDNEEEEQKEKKKNKKKGDKEEKDDKKEIGNTDKEAEEEVTLVEKVYDTKGNDDIQEDQTPSVDPKENQMPSGASSAGNAPLSIEEKFAEVNRQNLDNRYSYLEKYFEIAEEYGYPSGYSLPDRSGKREKFDVDKGTAHTNIQKRKDESLLMHMLADILPAVTGEEVYLKRDKNTNVNGIYCGSKINDNIDPQQINYQRLNKSPFAGYFNRLIRSLEPIVQGATGVVQRKDFIESLIMFIKNDINIMKKHMQRQTASGWLKTNEDLAVDTFFHDRNNNTRLFDGKEFVLPYDFVSPDDCKVNVDNNGKFKCNLIVHNFNTHNASGNNLPIKWDNLEKAAAIAFSCGDVFPCGNREKDCYYLAIVEYCQRIADNGQAANDTRGNFSSKVNMDDMMEYLKNYYDKNTDRWDFMSKQFDPLLKEDNWKKLFDDNEIKVIKERDMDEDHDYIPNCMRDSNNNYPNYNISQGYGPYNGMYEYQNLY